jgi:hypothetical protein
METMNATTVTKCLILNHSSILPELQEIVKSYLFYDTQTAEYQHRKLLRAVLSEINTASSRKNGFYYQEEDDTEDEHWLFSTEEFQLQAASCKVCGNYCAGNSMYTYVLSECVICECIRNEEELEEEEPDYDY